MRSLYFYRHMSRLVWVACAALAPSMLTAQPAEGQKTTGPSEAVMRVFLEQGKWNTKADDNISGEVLKSDFIKSLVDAYQADPKDQVAIANLSLIPLALATAEWGVSPASDLPEDPVGKNWTAVKSTGDGKHLMSYAKGGIGVMHQDSGGLSRLMDYLEKHHPDIVPPEHKAAFFKLKGTNFDKLYANGGHCTKPSTELRNDLSGEPFQHTQWGYAGATYCKTYQTGRTSLKDWQIFRHGMREALRREDVQFRIIRDFAGKEWASSYRLVVVDGKRDVREAFIVARIWNSAPRVGQCAFAHASSANSVDKRIQEELNAYADEAVCKGAKPRMKERWPYMHRAVVAYEAFSRK